MPKNVDYPRASLVNSIELADAVSSLGGSCTTEMAAERLNRKQGGAFTALVSAATKYGLLSSKSGKLILQQSYRDYALAYNESEKRSALRTALLSPPMFRAIYDRFQSKSLPMEHFEKLLIREFDVPGDQASKVSAYFLEGAAHAGMIGPGNVLVPIGESNGNEALDATLDDIDSKENPGFGIVGKNAQKTDQLGPGDYSITFKGPGLNSTIVVAEDEDLLIVDAMLKKVKKALAARNDES
ncbi:hypothetical protein GCM10007862_13720 [Dyella lipolytica]|uniref:Uncharacterized protein n=1 Tax=Dyella lipolytica TaxID=1867835 RepID=A0ABW8IVK3_9GAMM|nr:hypothetical protein [Dyella lipolytica]GLQ46321.1 hypothetical protein GCM10007862_13720 [Dyella lipolytica]